MRISTNNALVSVPPLQPGDGDLLQLGKSDLHREIDRFAAYLSRFMSGDDAYKWAESLIGVFGSLAEVWQVPHAELRRIGVPEPIIADFAHSILFWQELQWSKLRDRPVMQLWPEVREYLRITMRNLLDKEFRVLFLDSRSRLKADEVLFKGYENHVGVYPREVARRCLELRSPAIVIVRNAPDRDAIMAKRERDDDCMLEAVLASLATKIKWRVLVAGDDVRRLPTFSQAEMAALRSVPAPAGDGAAGRRPVAPREPVS